MQIQKTVILDPGHGGSDPGATYYGRQEKDDVLALAFNVGYYLEQLGVPVLYTRVTDTYDTPYEKAMIGNASGADYFVSLHRNAMPVPGSASGIESLVFEEGSEAAKMARNINAELKQVGYQNLGVIERPGLVVLRKTEMPAVLVEAGFIDNDVDNEIFDRSSQAIAKAIADGIYQTIQEEHQELIYYQIQTGAYRNRELAEQEVNQLKSQGFPAYLVYEDGWYKVRAGAFQDVSNAARLEQSLRQYGYQTIMVTGRRVE